MSQLRVVFDCNIYIQALASPGGPSGRCVQMMLDGVIRVFVSSVVLDELRDVTSRPKVAKKLKLDPERVGEFVEAIMTTATLLERCPTVFSYERDPDDAHYVNLSLAAHADLIVTRDNDLLDLMHAGESDNSDFRAAFPSIRILNPVAFLTELR